MDNYKAWLQAEYTERCKRNSRYSIRAFASLLEIDSSSLAQIFSGKRKLSEKMMARFCEKLGAPVDLQIQLQDKNTISENYHLIAMDSFTVMSDWYHTAILELINIKDQSYTPHSIAIQLDITTAEARIAMERLERLDLIEMKNGQYVRTKEFLTNYTQDISSTAHKKFQKQLLEKALLAIDTCKAEDKDITSITMAIDRSKLSEAKQIIKKFRREMATLLETGTQTQVYNLGIQLYPLSKERIKK